MDKNRLIIIVTLFIILYQAAGTSDDRPAIQHQSMLTKQDPRSYQHGIDFNKRSDGQYVLIWASSGIPPVGSDNDDEWTHDIYYSLINPESPKLNPVKIISAPGAQEPASSAITSDNRIMVTMEDAYQASNELVQTYAVYDASMKPVKSYQNKILDGGHSGHVSAVNNRFVVFYSEGWVDGGGVDQLGSGDDVLLSVYNSSGQQLARKNVSVGEHTRDWWPMIAGSTDHALLLWQRFVDGQTSARLMYKVFNPVTQHWIKKTTKLVNGLKYYSYDVQSIPELGLFLILGTYETGGGFAFLLTNTGDVVASHTALPAIVREAQPAISTIKNSLVRIVYPTNPGALAVISISQSSIQLTDIVPAIKQWHYSGADGIFLNQNHVYFASLAPEGIQTVTVKISP
jgi:hypothetical protein